MMESQVNYIAQYLDCLERAGEGSYLDVRAETKRTYNDRIQAQFAGTVWASGCKSWYVNAAGKNTTLYPRLTAAFRKETRKFNPSAYRLVRQREVLNVEL